MKLTRLHLQSYGHLTDVALDFPAEPGLHVVFGLNEAGKSTTLAAIPDALFGFGHKSRYAFLHDDLRVGFSLQVASGAEHHFIRRKGRKATLTDAEGSTVEEAGLARFLSGMSRERFENTFGLDGARLREGGRQLLEGKGEAAELIMQALTGLARFTESATKLTNEAHALFNPARRNASAAVYIAGDAFKAARTRLDSSSVSPEQHAKLREMCEALERQIETAGQESAELTAQRNYLDRISRTAPARAALTEYRAELHALGPAPALPGDAEVQRQEAIARRTSARALRTQAEESARAIAGELEREQPDAAVLADSAAIQELAAEQKRITSARRDRVEQGGREQALRQTLQALGAQLGLDADPAALAALAPNTIIRGQARAALDRHHRLDEALAAAKRDLDQAVLDRDSADNALAALPKPGANGALRDAVNGAQAEGKIDDAVQAAASECQAADAAARAALAAVPGWRADAEELKSLQPPLDAVIASHAKTIEATASEAGATALELRHLEQEVLDLTLELEAASAPGLPTEESLAALRLEREAAWRVIRARLAQAAIPGDADLAGYEARVQAADALSDRRHTEASALERRKMLLRQHGLATLKRDAAAAGDGRAQAALAVAQAAWASLCAPLGLETLPPPALAEWLHRRANALDLAARANAASRRLLEVQGRRVAARSALAACVAGEDQAADAPLAPLLRRVHRELGAQDAAEQSRAKAADALAAAAKRVTGAQRAVARAEADRELWQSGWSALAISLSLDPAASPEAGNSALDLWTRIAEAGRELLEVQLRVVQMTTAVQGFDSAVAELGAHHGVGALADPHAAARQLETRLQAALRLQDRRTKLLQDAGAAERGAAEAKQAESEAQTVLNALFDIAGVADDGGLQAALAKAARHRQLLLEITKREAELFDLGGGRTLAELVADAAGEEPDTIPARMDALGQLLAGLEQHRLERTAELTDRRRDLAELDGRTDAAAAAQAMHNAVEAAEDAARRHISLHMAGQLLRAAMERVRQQEQAPLLNRAGTLFSRMTGGRYQGLDSGEADGKPAVFAIPAGQKPCPAASLSEGARDQLFLALRLAALDADAEAHPFIADDLLVHFDDQRAAATLNVLAHLGGGRQTILFTHHSHLADLAKPFARSVQTLG